MKRRETFASPYNRPYPRAADCDRKDERKALAEQTITHNREINSLICQYLQMQDALRGALGLIRWLSSGVQQWQGCPGPGHTLTPADQQRIREWEELVRLAGIK